MKKYKKLTINIVLMFISFHAFSQFAIVNITWINTDKSLLSVLGKKLTVNSIITAEQTLIYTGLQNILKSKIATRIQEYEWNKHDRSLAVPLALNLTINNLLIGAPLATPSSFPFFITAAKNEYFIRELAINNVIALQIALVKNNNIRNVNTQELYSLNRKMLTKLKMTNKNARKNAAFVIVASLISKAAAMSESDLNQILSLGL